MDGEIEAWSNKNKSDLDVKDRMDIFRFSDSENITEVSNALPSLAD